MTPLAIRQSRASERELAIPLRTAADILGVSVATVRKCLPVRVYGPRLHRVLWSDISALNRKAVRAK